MESIFLPIPSLMYPLSTISSESVSLNVFSPNSSSSFIEVSVYHSYSSPAWRYYFLNEYWYYCWYFSSHLEKMVDRYSLMNHLLYNSSCYFLQLSAAVYYCYTLILLTVVVSNYLLIFRCSLSKMIRNQGLY